MTNTVALKNKMKARGLSQRRVSGMLFLSPNSLSHKIINDRAFTVDEVFRFCEILNIKDIETAQYLFGAREEQMLCKK